MWKNIENFKVREAGYKLWRHRTSMLYVLTAHKSKGPPEDDSQAGYYNLLDLLKLKGI